MEVDAEAERRVLLDAGDEEAGAEEYRRRQMLARRRGAGGRRHLPLPRGYGGVGPSREATLGLAVRRTTRRPRLDSGGRVTDLAAAELRTEAASAGAWWGLGGGLRAACGLAKASPLSLTDDASRAHAHGGHAPSKTRFASRVTCLPLRHLEASVRVAGGALPVDPSAKIASAPTLSLLPCRSTTYARPPEPWRMGTRVCPYVGVRPPAVQMGQHRAE